MSSTLNRERQATVHGRDQEHERRDTESSSQRQNRLQHMRDEEHERRDAESSAQRENRLQHMRDEEHEHVMLRVVPKEKTGYST